MACWRGHPTRLPLVPRLCDWGGAGSPAKSRHTPPPVPSPKKHCECLGSASESPAHFISGSYGGNRLDNPLQAFPAAPGGPATDPGHPRTTHHLRPPLSPFRERQDCLPIAWTTPAGFPVLQEYREDLGKVCNVHVGGKRVQLVLVMDGTKLDRRRQGLGISPNFVHSCDASHLMLTTCLGWWHRLAG